MNVYHITYAPTVKTAHLYFWGCNLSCRGCVRLKETYNYHIEASIFNETSKNPRVPERFLDLEEVMQILGKLEVRKVFFMGAEPATDPKLPQLAEALHQEFKSHNILLTNGFKLIDLKHIDEVAFSIKAVTDSLHRHYTGKSNKKALANFASLYNSGVKLRAESVLIPEYIDYPEIENIAKFIGAVYQGIPYRIDAYIPTGANPWRRPTPQEMKRAVSTAQKNLFNVSCLTGNEKLKFNVLRVF
ncbi:MAG TPA: radical SAM protein [Dehalococcoidales bacterium]|nr:radical SAM protein [Dehalococcoidales bacterium]